ncbi:WhiB family transcriptional regulator [Micromonospora sp. DT229]|uniref:WhiB family transcriptional regulator n=1 Tax=Micromonospora sp. DT229 TaxID=3393430 RepID=UPI003CFB4906
MSGWQELGLCNQTDPESFYPEKGASAAPAKRICAGCEVRVECLEYALDRREPYGIWGGKTEGERRKILRSATATTGGQVAA